MTIRHLKIFLAVVDCGKMSAAAEKLHITQPTISQAIAEIEKFYNILLFERLNKKLYLTESGKKMLSYASHIVSLFDEMEKEMLNRSKSTVLHAGATITVGTCVFDSLISNFEKETPDVKINVFVDNTSVIEDMILKSMLDFAVVEGEIKSPDIIVKPVIDDELVLVCSKNGQPFDRNNIDIHDLENLPFILREPGSGTRELFIRQTERNNVDINIKWVCNNSEAIKNAVMEGQGLTVISKKLVTEELEKGKLHLININNVELKRKFSLVYHKNKYLSEPINKFIRFMKTM